MEWTEKGNCSEMSTLRFASVQTDLLLPNEFSGYTSLTSSLLQGTSH